MEQLKNQKMSMNMPNRRNKIQYFFYRIKLKIKSFQIFWKIITSNDPKVKSEMEEFQNYLNEKEHTERMLLELSDEERELYYTIEKRIPSKMGSPETIDGIKRSIFKAAKIVKVEEKRKKELKELREKESLINAIMIVFDQYVDQKVDLAFKIYEKESELPLRKKMEIESILKESLKAVEV